MGVVDKRVVVVVGVVVVVTMGMVVVIVPGIVIVILSVIIIRGQHRISGCSSRLGRLLYVLVADEGILAEDSSSSSCCQTTGDNNEFVQLQISRRW